MRCKYMYIMSWTDKMDFLFDTLEKKTIRHTKMKRDTHTLSNRFWRGTIHNWKHTDRDYATTGVK